MIYEISTIYIICTMSYTNDCVYNHNFNESDYITPFTTDINEKTSTRCYNKPDIV